MILQSGDHRENRTTISFFVDRPKVKIYVGKQLFDISYNNYLITNISRDK